MRIIDDTIEARGFETTATAIAIRTIGSCYAMRFRPDDRPLVGVGLMTVREEGGAFQFDTAARTIAGGEMPGDLIDWLEARLPASGAIVSWAHRRPVSSRLTTLADPLRHPRIVAVAGDTQGRWRELPRSMTWHLRQATAPAIPCLCPAGGMATCEAELPAALLPEPWESERQLVAEAARGWITWANAFGDFDDHIHPARRALRALSDRQAQQRTAQEADPVGR